ncbi:MAG: LuxR C-terminal-related transcriptional regulator [Proteobacteria bacterium]|nr:LuxR C-terminal-related transcriptional regulator [Pseudomonadota bacterium]
MLRASLTERIAAAPAARLIVLRAPAGFGKTTAMLQHAARLAADGRPSAWITLDQADGDLGRLLRHLQAALAPAVSAAGSAGSAGTNALPLLAGVAAAAGDFTLFLDDFETIQGSAAPELLCQLLEHMPAGWQLVIGSRTVPNLGLGRLRAHGHLVEIGLDQLRFTPAETAEFLRQRRGLPLADDLVARLHAVTEGWVAALWLASVALEGRADARAFIESFSGGNVAVAEYLAEDVLAKQPEAVRDFLLRSSVLQQLSAPVCDALLERDDSAAMLERIERSMLFLTAIGPQPGHYRFHSLFADFLRTQLAQRDPAAVSALHRRAAQWYEAQGRPVPAIEHALRSRDAEHTARLLGAHAPALLHTGRFRLLARWFDKLPAALGEAHPMLAIVHAWALTFTHRHDAALALLQQLEARQRAGASAWDAEARAHLLALRPMLMSLMDRADAPALARSGHAQVDPRYRFPYSLLTNTLATYHASANRSDEARALLDQARRSHLAIGSTFSLVIAECIEGFISLREGRLQQAIARFRLATNHLRLDGPGDLDGNPYGAVQLALALYEVGQLDEAARILAASMPMVRELGHFQHLVLAHLTLSRLAWHRGEPERAFGFLSELEYLGHQDDMPRVVESAEIERSRLALLRCDHKGAAAYLRRAEEAARARPTTDDPMHDVESTALARLRLLLRSGQAERALAALPAAVETARAQGRQRQLLVLDLLWAEALQAGGQPGPARAHLTQALQRAGPEGVLQPFVDEGPAVAALTLAWCRSAAVRDRPPPGATAAWVGALERACAAVAAEADAAGEMDGTPAAAAGPALTEPLTYREIHVLKLLARGQSNAAMADALFVSENTIRSHLRNIFSKLGAHNRTEAANLARRHRLID